jgi:DNA (cytosine-5)-methyltransferase 1
VIKLGLTFLDFFAGVGGFRKGMEMAGHKCLGHCEIDKYANMSYAAIHEPKEDEWFGTDIKRTNADELPRADAWCFGFPCQDISVAGKQLGFKGQRSSLFFTVTRLIRDTKEEDRPKYLFIENVKNLLSVNGGTDFLKLLIELDEIGYDAEWQVINSRYFGVPQNRERVFIIGHLRGRSTRKVFPITGTNQPIGVPIKRIAHANKFRRYHQTYDTNSSIESLDTCQGGGRHPCVRVIGNVHPSGKGMNGQVYDSEGLCPTLTTNKGEGNKILVRAVSAPDRINKSQNGRRFKEDGEPMFTLTAQDRHGVAILRPVRTEYGKAIRKAYESGEIQESRHNMTKLEPRNDGITNTLTTVQKDNLLLSGCRIRRLTPRECWRLQAWSDEEFEKAASVCSDSQLYKQAGNGVTVNVIYEIAKRLA